VRGPLSVPPSTFNSPFNGGNLWAQNHWDYYPMFTMGIKKQQLVVMATRFPVRFFFAPKLVFLKWKQLRLCHLLFVTRTE
jgi:hypothetical protein